MNYDLFVPPAVVESAAALAAGAGSGQAGQLPPAAAKRHDLPPLGASTADRPPRDSASDPLFTEEVDSAVSAFNEVFKQANVGVCYQVDKKTGDLIIKLVDRDTQKVLRQVPPDQILAMRQRLEELLGVIFDQTA
jgi:flagellar protein FlaG